MRGDQFRGFELAIAEFGVGVDMPAPFNHVLFQAIRMIAYRLAKREQRIRCVHWRGLLVGR